MVCHRWLWHPWTNSLSNEEWPVKELNSFLLNEGADLSGKRRSCWSGKFSAFNGYFGLL